MRGLRSSRPPKAETWLAVASTIAKQSTCLRRQVGCVLTDHRGHVLATGWNGVASGQPHCNDDAGAIAPKYEHRADFLAANYPNACTGATAPPGTSLDACQALHAEWNALLQCENVYAIQTVYCTASPCMTCVKLLLGTGAREIYFLEEYPAPGAKELWQKSRGIVWYGPDVSNPTWVKWPL
jgi:dCMP deaminase